MTFCGERFEQTKAQRHKKARSFSSRLDATIIYMAEQLNPNMDVVCVSRNLIIFHFALHFAGGKNLRFYEALRVVISAN